MFFLRRLCKRVSEVGGKFAFLIWFQERVPLLLFFTGAVKGKTTFIGTARKMSVDTQGGPKK